MNAEIPKHIVHYSRGKPFQSITGTPPMERDNAISMLDDTNSWGRGRFADLSYLSQRLEVEAKMRAEFIERGGSPILSHPIYFFLGRNNRFEQQPLNKGYAIDLSDLNRNVVSFSYGDTMLSFNEENRSLSGEPYRHSLFGRLFMLDEIVELLRNEVFMSSAALAIEAHLWMQPQESIVKKSVKKVDPPVCKN